MESNPTWNQRPRHFFRAFVFCRTYVFSTDHKIIGLQYGMTALLFLLLGFSLMLLMRWQLAYPGQPIPVLGVLLQKVFGQLAAGGAISPDLYNAFTTMHGTIMVFLGIVPLGFAAFGNYFVPLQIGAPDMAFPRINMVSYQFYVVGGVILLVSFFIPGGTAQSGWTSYSPLATTGNVAGQTMLLLGLVFLGNSSVLGSVNFIATIIQLRAQGMNWSRLPFFVWAQFVTAFLLLLAFPPLVAAALLQMSDALLHTSFFIPIGFVAPGGAQHFSGGGSPLLWQHLFWFLAHPEVYVLLLPALGIVTEIIACNTRRPIWGYRAMVWSASALGVLSLVVWGHHMFVTGMGTKVSTVFQTTTMAVSIPSVIMLTTLLISLWGSSIRFNTPMLFALAFLPMFGIGGLSGLPLGFNATNVHLHDTYYIIAHFHYIVAPGTIFALFAGIYHWYPKVTGRMMSEALGRTHFWLSLLFMNLIFQPMFIQGMSGMNRRLSDGGATYAANKLGGSWTAFHVYLNVPIAMATWLLALAQIPFVINFFWSMRRGLKAPSDNPWEATTLEWQTPTPPPHGNFVELPKVHRAAYEYSVPTHSKDYCPQNLETL